MLDQFIYDFQMNYLQILALDSELFHFDQRRNTSKNLLNFHTYFINPFEKDMEVPLLWNILSLLVFNKVQYLKMYHSI